MSDTCEKTGKVAYSKEEAHQQAHRMRLKYGSVSLQAYRCPQCKSWHVGHRAVRLKHRRRW